MNDRDALLAAILAQPGEDTPRLALADWLEEHNSADRAEFIRVQIELHPVRDQLDNSRAVSLRAREIELLDTPDVRSSCGRAIHPSCVTWRRGFVDEIRIRASDWMRDADDICASNPVLRRVVLLTHPRVRHRPGIRFKGGYLFDGRLSAKAEMLHPTNSPPDMLRTEWPRIEFELPEPEEE